MAAPSRLELVAKINEAAWQLTGHRKESTHRRMLRVYGGAHAQTHILGAAGIRYVSLFLNELATQVSIP
jgi:hypothetical protein